LETVFSDPARAKVTFLTNTVTAGSNVVLCFIGISGPAISEERVAMRVSQGGHDVPFEKLVSRYPPTLANLKAATQTLPVVLIFDNDDLAGSFRKLAEFRSGKKVFLAEAVPQWLRSLLWR
jgi:predicted ABC-type ATPase